MASPVELEGSAEPTGPSPPDGPSSRRRPQIEPLHVLLVLAALAALVIASGPITDIDTYWHVLIGREILDTGHLSNLGTSWSLNLTGTDWHTTQWLSEVVMARTQSVFGWRGIIVLRGLLSLVLVLLLARQLLRRAVPRVAAPVFAVVAIPVAAMVQERPMLATLILAVWLGGAATDLLLDGRRPNLWLVLGLTVLWANLHGGWVLAPTAFGVVAVACAIEGADQFRKARTAAIAAAVSLAAGCLTPLGPAGLLAPWRFRSSTALIGEWKPTEAWGTYGLAVGILVAALVWTWSRGGVRPPAAELLYTFFWAAFAMQAFRNVAPTLIVIAPLVVERISRSYHPTRAVVTRRESRILGGVMVALTVLATGFLVHSYAAVDPLENAKPLAIAKTLAATPGEKRVLNSYNASGVLAEFGGPGVRLAVDGRADRYGNAFIQRYADAEALVGDWQGVLRQVDPDYAVLHTKSPLAAELQREGWRLVQTDRIYELLQRPR